MVAIYYFVPDSIYEYWRGDGRALRPSDGVRLRGRSWTTFDTLQLGALAGGFQGAAFDGRYIYFVPWGDTSTGTPLSIQGAPLHHPRYDTMATFTTMASWATFDPSAVTSSNAFVGAAFDGRYVYFSPGDYRGQALRYDTQASFAAGASWSSFDMTSLGGGAQSAFLGARFDGRYVYFIPSGGVLERFDTTGTFGSAASWTRFDSDVARPAGLELLRRRVRRSLSVSRPAVEWPRLPVRRRARRLRSGPEQRVVLLN